MNQADWMSAGGAAAGVVGIGSGIWWADAVAAIVISIDIVHEGQKYLREEEGHVLAGEVWVVPSGGAVTAEQTETLTKRLLELDWRVRDIVVVPVAASTGRRRRRVR